MSDFTMPSLGADMEEGTLLEWLVKPGDTVKKGDLMAVVDTAKAAIEIETFHDGVVTALLIEPGTTVAVGAPIATMDLATATVEERPPAAEEHPEARPPVVEEAAEGSRVETTPSVPTQPAPPQTEQPQHGPVQISPYARKLARKLGVDIEPLWQKLRRPIREADVRAAAASVVEPVEAPVVEEAAEGRPPVVEEREPEAVVEEREARLETTIARTADMAGLTKNEQMRAAIARLMARSKREIPHYYLELGVDLEPALTWMHARNLELDVSERLVPAALMLKATALAVAETPELNGFWIDDHFSPAEKVHLGMAVSLRGGGMVAPAIHDAASLSVTDLMATMKDLVQRARAGRLRGSELTDGTITVTNLGEQGVDLVHGVIYPPQVALVGFGRPTLRPWIVGGGVAPRTVTEITLAADHRASDGFVGSRLLDRIAHHLLQPEQL